VVSQYTALRQVTNLLITRLTDAFQAEPLLNALLAMGHVISPRTPAEMQTASPQLKGLSAWLYQVDRDEYLLNRPPERVGLDLFRRPPVPLDLHYLITPMTDDPINEQLMLGKVVQVLNDQAIFPASPADPELQDEIRATLENPGVDALSRLWTALDQPHRLSVSYLLQVIEIDSGEQPERGLPVLEKTTVYEQVVAGP
jgi:hypothetical protein